MAKFDHERVHMAANLVSDPPVTTGPRRAANNASRNHRSARCTTGPRRAVKD